MYDEEFYDIFFPFSEGDTRKLIKIYQKSFTTKYNSHKEVKSLPILSDIVRELQIIATVNELYSSFTSNNNFMIEVVH
jgi:hypothetical protein